MSDPIIKWQSEGAAPSGEPYLTVLDRDGYVYAQRAGTDSVAFVLYDYSRFSRSAGLLKSPHPPRDTMKLGAFTGTIEPGMSPLEVVVMECREEAGFEVPAVRVSPVGVYNASTQSNERVHVYAVNVMEIRQQERKPQDDYERQSEVVWGSFQHWSASGNLDDWAAVLAFKMVADRY